MTTRYMQHFFKPQSIAVIGASERSMSLGRAVLRNLLDAGYQGELMAVNRRGNDRILGVKRHASVAELERVPDLAVICTSPATIPSLVDALGKKGVRAVLIVMGGLSRPAPLVGGAIGNAIEFAHSVLGLRLESGKTLKEATWEAARPYDLRIMGPNCIGVLVPRNSLNASYAHTSVADGEIAYVGQSGTLGLALIDRVKGRGLGVSHLTTLGDSLDIDIAEVLEYLEEDRQTRAVLVHLERLRSGARLLSALRAASRTKLVIVIKSRRVNESQEPPEPAAPGLLESDSVYDAALRRAGVLRVQRIDEVFDALEVLTRMRAPAGDRLAVLCNGIGPGMLAVDQLVLSGGTLAALGDGTVEAICELLPSFWSGRNPVDINADAPPDRFGEVLQILGEDPGIDAILVVHVPTLAAPAAAAAETVIAATKLMSKPVLTSWLGQHSAESARSACASAGLSSFATPEQAVDAFMYMVRYQRNQAELSQTPPALGPEEWRFEPGTVWALIGEAVNDQRELLTDEECERVLAAVGIPLAESLYVDDGEALREAAERFSPPFAIKVLTEATRRPFADDDGLGAAWRDVGLDVQSVDEVERVARALTHRTGEKHPQFPIQGFKLQRTPRGFDWLQLSLGITRDKVFGPLVLFGSGGSRSRALKDRQMGLPPLNLPLARLLIEAAQAGRELDQVSADAERDRDLLARMLVNLGELVVEVPAIALLEIDPVVVTSEGIFALSARIALGEPAETAIVPYPADLEETVTLARSGRTVLLRPIRGEDAPAHAAFIGRLSPETIRYRFFQPRSNFTRRELWQATQIDYTREMAFIATYKNEQGVDETLGVVRAWADPDNVSAECAIIVDDEVRGEGLGSLLFGKLIDYERRRGVLELRGTVLPENAPMQNLARKLGFESHYSDEDEALVITLALNPPTDDWQRERLGQRQS